MQLIYFPWMHPECAPHAASLGVRFLDPALEGGQREGLFWTPEGLPLDRRQAKRYIEEALSFGEQFQDYKELEYLRAAGLEDFFSGTTSSLSDELKRRLGEHEDERDDPVQERKKQGQMALLLSWMLEDKLLQADSGEREYRSMMAELRKSLGLEDSGEPGPYDGEEDLGEWGAGFSRWANLMPWFLLFLPREGILYLEDEEIWRSLQDNGLKSKPLPDISGYEELQTWVRGNDINGELGVGEGWRLALLTGPDGNLSWLDREFPLFFRRE